MRYHFRYFLLFCFPLFLNAQETFYRGDKLGFNISANFALGTHFQRLGLNFNLFYVQKAVQLNSEVRSYFSFKNLGPGKIYTEFVFSQGIVVAYGKNTIYGNPFFNSVSNQTGKKNSFGYSYNYYFNKVATKQVSGIVALQFGNMSFITENDILAKPILDRFRTGAMLLQYQYKDQFQAAINCTMWTGEMGRTTQNENFPYGCFMDTSGGKFVEYSHGLLSAQFKYHIGGAQNLQANVGIDAEQVRNAVQNRVIHDFCFIPRKWLKRNNCHIPMLTEKGDQYLFLPDQKIKSPKVYWNMFSNANLFY